jgi:hypothetical protein
MTHAEFLEAFQAQVRAYDILHRAIERASEPEFLRLFHMDPFTRAVREEFGSPLVEWLRDDPAVFAVQVDDGTVFFEPGPELTTTVYFVAESVVGRAVTPGPAWKKHARIVGRFEGGRVFRPSATAASGAATSPVSLPGETT